MKLSSGSVNEQNTGAPFKLKPFGFKGDDQMLTDWAAIRDAIYEGRGGNPPRGESAEHED